MWVFLWPGCVGELQGVSERPTSHTGGRKLPLTRPVTSFNPLCDPSDAQRGFTAHPWPSHTHSEQRGSVRCLKKTILLCGYVAGSGVSHVWSILSMNRSVVWSINCEKVVRDVDQRVLQCLASSTTQRYSVHRHRGEKKPKKYPH